MDALQVYSAIPYKELHDCLARRFHAWYKTFKPKSTAVVVSAEDAEVCDVVEVAGPALEILPPRPCQLRESGRA